MVDKIEKYEVLTPLDLVIRERERLIRMRGTDPKWWQDSSRCDWAKAEFGDNLDEITTIGFEENKEYCQVCGRFIPFDEKFISLKFSFCEEYKCGMSLCKNCTRNFLRELK